MISKKEALILGILVIGGAGLASMVNDGGEGGGAKAQPRYGAILGTQTSPTSQPGASPTYNIKQADVSFPAPPTYDIASFLNVPEIDAMDAPVKEYSNIAPRYVGGSSGTYYGKSPAQLQTEMKKVQSLPGAVTTKIEGGTKYYYKEILGSSPSVSTSPAKKTVSAPSRGFVPSGSGFVSTPATRAAAGMV